MFTESVSLDKVVPQGVCAHGPSMDPWLPHGEWIGHARKQGKFVRNPFSGETVKLYTDGLGWIWLDRA